MFLNNCFFCRRCNCNQMMKGEGWTTTVIKWKFIMANVPEKLVFDGFRATANVGKSDDNTALVIRRSGCYDLEYLVNVSKFDTSDHNAYTGIEVYLTANGNPVSQSVRVDPIKGIHGTTVATDKMAAVRLNQGDEISLVLRASTNGTSMIVTPSAWLDAYFVCP